MEIIMQKVINVLAVLSFLGTASIVGAGAYVYINKDSLIEQAKEAATKAATEAVVGALPGMLDGLMPGVPELPSATGGALPTLSSSSGTGGGMMIPNF